MRRLLIVFAWVWIMSILPGCDILQQIELPVSQTLSETDIVNGLKEALKVGTRNGISFLNRENGYFGDSLLRIPFPNDVKQVEIKLRALGLNRQVDQFILSMNRGAEKAVQKAGPIFLSAITEMSFSDARNILNGPDNAAKIGRASCRERV